MVRSTANTSTDATEAAYMKGLIEAKAACPDEFIKKLESLSLEIRNSDHIQSVANTIERILFFKRRRKLSQPVPGADFIRKIFPGIRL